MSLLLPNNNYTVDDYQKIIALVLRYNHGSGTIDWHDSYRCHDGFIRTTEETINFYTNSSVLMPLDGHGTVTNPITIHDEENAQPPSPLDVTHHGPEYRSPAVNFPEGLGSLSPISLSEDELSWEPDMRGALLDLCDNDAVVDLHHELMFEPEVLTPVTVFSTNDDECSCIMEWDDCLGQFICVNGGIQHSCP